VSVPWRVSIRYSRSHVGALQHQQAVGVEHQDFADAVVGVRAGRHRRLGNGIGQVGDLAQRPAASHVEQREAAGPAREADARHRAVLHQRVLHRDPGA
jgi:hypothetical protein